MALAAINRLDHEYASVTERFRRKEASSWWPQMFSLILIVQIPTESTAEQKPDEAAPTIKINILVGEPVSDCKPSVKDEIVVCAEKTDQERYRLRPIMNAEKYEPDPIKAEIALSDKATILSEGEAASLPQGVQSNRIMVRARIKF